MTGRMMGERHEPSRIVSRQFEIHQSPLERLVYEGPSLVVEFDDVEGHRIHLEFSPWQALKVTTIDYFDVEPILIDGQFTRHMLECTDSAWVTKLKAELHLHDHSADFLDQAHHYILPFQDNIVEVVAWDFDIHVT
jgi:hypothetical protein